MFEFNWYKNVCWESGFFSGTYKQPDAWIGTNFSEKTKKLRE